MHFQFHFVLEIAAAIAIAVADSVVALMSEKLHIRIVLLLFFCGNSIFLI